MGKHLGLHHCEGMGFVEMRSFLFLIFLMMVACGPKPGPVNPGSDDPIPQDTEMPEPVETDTYIPDPVDTDIPDPVDTETKDTGTEQSVDTQTINTDPMTPCEAACENLRLIGCPGAEGSPGPDEMFGTQDDVPCADVCQEVENLGRFSLNPECISTAETCEQVDACSR